MSQTLTLGVAGMTCGHCVRSVDEELRAVPGVTDVAIELVAGATSTVTLTTDRPVDDEALADAVREAGYAVVPPRSLL